MKLTRPSVLGLMPVILIGAFVAPSLADHTVSREQQPTVLCRGPVHEGFATPAVHTRHRGPAIAETPPEPLVEKPPGYSKRDNTLTWLPGYWARDTQAKEFVWVSGCWRRAPPAQRWLAGYWHENDEGHAWIPGAWVDAGQEVTFLPPPPEPSSEALAASTASADQFVVPGSWQYETGKYRWRPAFSSALRDGWVWIPAHYTEAANGFLYNDGFWDYDFTSRGKLFAPVRLESSGGEQAIMPTTALTTRVLLHLFHSPSDSSYRFGNYYDSPEIVPWFVTGKDPNSYPDPHLRYYQWKVRPDLPHVLERWHAYFKAYPANRPAITPDEQATLVENQPVSQSRRQVMLADTLSPASVTEAAGGDRRFVSLSRELPAKRMEMERALLQNSLPTRASLWKVPVVGFHGDPAHPLVVRISEDWLRAQVVRPVDWKGGVNKVVLQTRVYGNSRTTGDVTLDLLPCPEAAKLRLAFTGRTVATTRGYNGPVIIHTTSWTDFESKLDVEFDAESGFQARLVTIAGKTGSRTNQVTTTRGGLMEGIIRRVAWRRINASRSQANAITNRTTKADVAAGFRNEAAIHLARVNEKLDLPRLLPDMLTSATNGRHHVCSTDDAILICIGGHRPVVPTLPEADSPADLQLWVHSSLLNSKFAMALKGMEGLETIGPGLALLAPSELRSTKGILEVVAKRWLPIHSIDRQGEWMVLQLNESVVSNTFAANPSP
ncbi:MAG TPA: hypothetical protein VMM76_20285 [Pirellulaceae bacterium]|nr:hypothetical protein [Pirellulaceae bacterium]